jgi:hypothetical protein
MSVLFLDLALGRYVSYQTGQTVDRGLLFGPSSPLFGVSQKLFTASGQSIVLCLTVLFGSTYLGEEDFSQIKIIKSRYRNCLTNKRLKILPLLVPN